MAARAPCGVDIGSEGASVCLNADPCLGNICEHARRAVADVGYEGGVDDADICGLDDVEGKGVHSSKVGLCSRTGCILHILIGPPVCQGCCNGRPADMV